MKPSKLILAVALLSFSSLSMALSVKNDWKRDQDFKQYKTFAFGAGATVPDLMSKERIEKACIAELQKKGLTLATSGEPDLELHIHIRVSTETRVDVDTYGYAFYPGWYGGVGVSSATVREYPVGTGVFDLVDAKTGTLVWRAIATDYISPASDPVKADRKAAKGAVKVFKRYPPPPESKK